MGREENGKEGDGKGGGWEGRGMGREGDGKGGGWKTRGDGKEGGWEGKGGGMGREGDGKGGRWEGRGGKASEMMMESAATGSPIKRKTFGARTRTNNKLNPHLTLGLGIELGHSSGR